MPILALLAAGLIVMPQADNRSLRSMPDAYPTRALQQAKSGAIYVRTWVDPTGKTYRCEVLRHFGDEIFRSEGCKPLVRLTLRPATAPSGTASFAVVTTMLKYTTPGGNRNQIEALQQPAAIELDTISVGASMPDFRIAVLVNADGVVEHCEGFEGASGSHVELACATASESGQSVETDAGGNPVAYVTTLLVRIGTGSS